jgi:hypothetical protein
MDAASSRALRRPRVSPVVAVALITALAAFAIVSAIVWAV